MKKKTVLIGFALLIACLGRLGADERPEIRNPTQSRVDAHASAVQLAIDWPSFLERNDPVWERLPETWMEGAFIGNGRLGAMIYKGDQEAEPAAEVLAWTVNRSDLYDNRDPENKDGSQWTMHTRMPAGRLHLCPTGMVKEGRLRIDLWNGEARGTLQTEEGVVEWRSWVQPGDAESGVVVILLETDDGEKATQVKWQPFKSIVPRFHSRPQEGYQPNPPGRQESVGDTQVWIQPLLLGGDYATAWKTVELGNNRKAVFLAIGYGRIGGGSAKSSVAAVEAAAQRGVEALQEENRSWWHAFYRKSFVSIPDARIESHYWLQMYKLASATREGGVVIDTCGPWLKVDTVWPACWWNLNMQLNMYPLPVANHLELYEPLNQLLKQELDNGNLIRNAPEEMRHDSAYLGNPTTTYNLINNTVYWGGRGDRTGRLRPGASLNHLSWICHSLWEYYRRNMDDEFLRETLFPLTRRAYNFVFHFLEEGEDGRIHIQDTFSSEYGTAYDSNEAIALVQWGTGALLWMCERLAINDPDIPRWKDIRKRLVDPPVDETGLRIGADLRLEHGHRHYSHLMSIVPFRAWDFQDPESRELAYRSLEHFLHFERGLAGYSYTGASSMYAALGDGDRALATLQTYFQKYDRPNTMYTETNPASPVMETPLSAARCVQDMLLLSHDVLRIFPAVPNAWKDTAFHNLLAEGAFEVSAVRQEGKTRFVRIKSLAGEPCRVITGLKNPIRLLNNERVPLTVDARGIVELELAIGETAVLTEEDYRGHLRIRPLPRDASEANFYGLKNLNRTPRTTAGSPSNPPPPDPPSG